MHDSKGREIKFGDVVKFNGNTQPRFGLVAVLYPAQSTCNVELVTLSSWDMPANGVQQNPLKVTCDAAGKARTVSAIFATENAKDCEIVAAVDGRDLAPVDLTDGQTHAVQATAAAPENN